MSYVLYLIACSIVVGNKQDVQLALVVLFVVEICQYLFEYLVQSLELWTLFDDAVDHL